MAGADEIAEQAIAVEVAREGLDAATPKGAAAVPIGGAGRVEMRQGRSGGSGDIAAAGGVAEERQEACMVGQVLQCGELEATERDMRPVEVDRADPGRPRREIGERVAAAGRDRDDVVPRLDRQRLHVDDRVFPDLRIDQAAEGEGEEALEQAGLGERAALMDGGCRARRSWRAVPPAWSGSFPRVSGLDVAVADRRGR